nr:Ycf36 [Pseudoerythrocladia kornmannii]
MFNKKSCPVPSDQQPLEEYNSLIVSKFFSLPAKKIVFYFGFLLAILIISILLFSLLFFSTDASSHYNVQSILELFIIADIPVCFCILRLYFSWAYVSKRLLSATVFYEESGWYDGQIWVKTTDVLIHDRLIAMNISIPLIKKIKFSILIFGFKFLLEMILRLCLV